MRKNLILPTMGAHIAIPRIKDIEILNVRKSPIKLNELHPRVAEIYKKGLEQEGFLPGTNGLQSCFTSMVFDLEEDGNNVKMKLAPKFYWQSVAFREVVKKDEKNGRVYTKEEFLELGKQPMANVSLIVVAKTPKKLQDIVGAPYCIISHDKGKYKGEPILGYNQCHGSIFAGNISGEEHLPKNRPLDAALTKHCKDDLLGFKLRDIDYMWSICIEEASTCQRNVAAIARNIDPEAVFDNYEEKTVKRIEKKGLQETLDNLDVKGFVLIPIYEPDIAAEYIEDGRKPLFPLDDNKLLQDVVVCYPGEKELNFEVRKNLEIRTYTDAFLAHLSESAENHRYFFERAGL